MVIPLISKLRHGARLTQEDEAVLAEFVRSERMAERGDILPEGAIPRSVIVISKGWACRYKQLETGKRQITSLLLPGDLCEPFGTLPPVMDHTLAALTPVLLARVPVIAIRTAARNSSAIEDALWWDLLLSEGIHREHMISLGRRTATERLGHLFCEVRMRLAMVGLADEVSCGFPLTQLDLADLFGLSAVHVNRSLQELRGDGLLSLRERRLVIHDEPALRALSMFDPAYLQLRPIGAP